MYKNINFIYVSEYLKNMSIMFFKNYGINIDSKNQNVIYNALYSNDFIKNDNIIKNKNNIVYASSWTKGLNKILDLFDYLLLHMPNLTLTILCPSYSSNNIDFLDRIQKNKNIIFIGNVNKNKYCEIIQSSMCVLSPSFLETFGCVFAESYYLGTPVIADINTGAVKEIIDNNFIVNYNDKKMVLNKIKELQNNNYSVKLHNKFLDVNIINKWLELN
jgi:glycosyltransferase involved in cell wall biosynthesis